MNQLEPVFSRAREVADLFRLGRDVEAVGVMVELFDPIQSLVDGAALPAGLGEIADPDAGVPGRAELVGVGRLSGIRAAGLVAGRVWWMSGAAGWASVFGGYFLASVFRSVSA